MASPSVVVFGTCHPCSADIQSVGVRSVGVSSVGKSTGGVSGTYQGESSWVAPPPRGPATAMAIHKAIDQAHDPAE